MAKKWNGMTKREQELAFSIGNTLFEHLRCKICKEIKTEHQFHKELGICNSCYNRGYYLVERANRVKSNPADTSRCVTTLLRAVRDLRNAGRLDHLKASAWEADALAIMHDVWAEIGSDADTQAEMREQEREADRLTGVDQYTINKVIEALRQKGLLIESQLPDEDQPLTEGSPQETQEAKVEAAPPVESKPVEKKPAA